MPLTPPTDVRPQLNADEFHETFIQSIQYNVIITIIISLFSAMNVKMNYTQQQQQWKTGRL